MLQSSIKEKIRNLTPSERIDLIQYALSLFKNDNDELNRIEQEPNDDNEKRNHGQPSRNTTLEDWTLASLALSIAEAGEQALKEGAPELPSDFATNHDHYLYGKPKN